MHHAHSSHSISADCLPPEVVSDFIRIFVVVSQELKVRIGGGGGNLVYEELSISLNRRINSVELPLGITRTSFLQT